MSVDPLSTTRRKVGLNVREDIRATWSLFLGRQIQDLKDSQKEC